MRIEINLENTEDTKEAEPVSKDLNIIDFISYKEQKLTITVEDYEYTMPAYIAEITRGVSRVQQSLQKKWEAEETTQNFSISPS